MYFYCEKCKKKYPINSHSYQCECGGMFKLHRDPGEEYADEISLGEVVTPLVHFKSGKLDFLLKLEGTQPTGAFKDRGARRLINEIKHVGIEKIALDSAGNAGAAIAAYAAAAGMECEVYVPDDTSQEILHQIESYGATIKKVENGRMRVCSVVKENLGDAYYASHVYNPLFVEGVKSMAKEIYKQLGEHVPDYIFVPVGNGSLLMGLYYGFLELGRLPQIVGVQSEKCAPLYEAFHGLEPQPKTASIARAIRIERPKRGLSILKALKNCHGDMMTVKDEEILEAQKRLGKAGIYVELSAACALAAAERFFQAGKPDNYRVVVPLTATGLKR